MFHTQRVMAATVLITATCVQPLFSQTDERDVGELHAVLQSDDASIHDKAVACKRLAVIGTPASVPVLAGLLTDERLSHYARFGLQAIPDAAVDNAFREALGELKGQLLVGVINSIGQRRDAQAVEPLTDLLANADPRTAAAAAAALGQIANQPAVDTLLARLKDADSPIRVAVADAALVSARRLAEEGETDRAVSILEAVRQSDVPQHIRIGATDSLILTRGSAALPLIRELLQSDDGAFFAVALQASRALSGDAVTQALIDNLDGQQPDRKALLLLAIGDRGDANALPAVRQAARSEETAVQVAAIRTLGQLGDSSDVDRLMDLAVSDDEQAAEAARDALVALAGSDVNEAIVSQQNQDDQQRLEVVVALAGRRRIDSAVPAVLKALESPSDSLRLAAIRALGETAGRAQLDILAQKIVSPASPAEEQAAKAALIAACSRLPDQETGTEYLISLFSDAPPERRGLLFELLKEIGGESALAYVVASARERNDTVQDAATRVLGEWLSVDVAPELLELAQTLDSNKYRIRALRGYIRIFRQFGHPPDESAAMARRAMGVADRDEERKLVLESLVRFPSTESLALAVEHLQTPGLQAPAAEAAVDISERLADSNPDIVRKAMQGVSRARVNTALKNRAQAVLQQVAND